MDTEQNDLTSLADPQRLGSYIAATLGVGQQPLTIESQVKSGSSNVTLFLRWGDERWVLRRPPRGPLLPTSHDMLREFRFLTALAGSDVPIPTPVLACNDANVIGVPFFVMKRVDGTVLQDGYPSAIDNAECRRYLSESAIDALVAIHAADWQTRGLTGPPDPYIDRQIRRWTRQLELTATKERVAGLRRVTEWLNVRKPPPASPTIVHGDFGLHNMIVRSVPPGDVLAVLDWEMATIGDPIADVVWFLRGWGEVPSRNPANYVTGMPGCLSADEMLARYQDRSGRRIGDTAFYEVFCGWKGAIILEGLYATYLEGNAANENVARFEWEVPQSVESLLARIS